MPRGRDRPRRRAPDLSLYDRSTAYFVARKFHFLNRQLAPVKEGKALDIGCNFGTFTELLREKGYDSVGIEVEAKFLEHARKHGKAQYLNASAENLPFADNSFDVVLLLDTLEHVINRGKALEEINRVLKPLGRIYITVPNTWSYFYLRSFVTYAVRGAQPWKNVHYQQNFFHWEHQISQFLRILNAQPILKYPLFEPKLMKGSRLADIEFGARGACFSADPMFICTKRDRRVDDNTDSTEGESQ